MYGFILSASKIMRIMRLMRLRLGRVSQPATDSTRDDWLDSRRLGAPRGDMLHHAATWCDMLHLVRQVHQVRQVEPPSRTAEKDLAPDIIKF